MKRFKYILFLLFPVLAFAQTGSVDYNVDIKAACVDGETTVFVRSWNVVTSGNPDPFLVKYYTLAASGTFIEIDEPALIEPGACDPDLSTIEDLLSDILDQLSKEEIENDFAVSCNDVTNTFWYFTRVSRDGAAESIVPVDSGVPCSVAPSLVTTTVDIQCNNSTNTWYLFTTVVDNGSVVSTTSEDLTTSCNEEKPQYIVKRICTDGLVYDLVYTITAGIEVEKSSFNTQISCLAEEQISVTSNWACDNGVSIMIDRVFVDGVLTEGELPTGATWGICTVPVIRTNIDVECNGFTDTWNAFTTVTENGAVISSTVEDTSQPCSEEKPEYIVKRICNNGFVYDVVYTILDGVEIEKSSFNTLISCAEVEQISVTSNWACDNGVSIMIDRVFVDGVFTTGDLPLGAEWGLCLPDCKPYYIVKRECKDGIEFDNTYSVIDDTETFVSSISTGIDCNIDDVEYITRDICESGFIVTHIYSVINGLIVEIGSGAKTLIECNTDDVEYVVKRECVNGIEFDVTYSVIDEFEAIVSSVSTGIECNIDDTEYITRDICENGFIVTHIYSVIDGLIVEIGDGAPTLIECNVAPVNYVTRDICENGFIVTRIYSVIGSAITEIGNGSQTLIECNVESFDFIRECRDGVINVVRYSLNNGARVEIDAVPTNEFCPDTTLDTLPYITKTSISGADTLFCDREMVEFYQVGEKTALSLVNSSFEDALTNGSTLPTAFAIVPADDVPGWEQTPSSQIEIWTDGFQGRASQSGGFFIELSPNAPGIIFQNFTVDESAGQLCYSVWHRKRSGVDTASIQLGENGNLEVVAITDVSNASDWTNYTGCIEKDCGVTEMTIGFETITPVGSSSGNLLDNIEVEFLPYGDKKEIGFIDCDNILTGIDKEVIDINDVCFDDPSKTCTTSTLIACIASCQNDEPVWINKYSDGTTTVTADDTGVDNWCVCDDSAFVELEPCSTVRRNFFNENQFSWGFSVQSSSAVDQWQYFIDNADYQIDPSTVDNNADFTYTEIDNGDGTYDLYFTSTSGLPANTSSNNYQIQGVNFGFDPSSDGQTINCE